MNSAGRTKMRLTMAVVVVGAFSVGSIEAAPRPKSWGKRAVAGAILVSVAALGPGAVHTAAAAQAGSPVVTKNAPAPALKLTPFQTLVKQAVAAHEEKTAGEYHGYELNPPPKQSLLESLRPTPKRIHQLFTDGVPVMGSGESAVRFQVEDLSLDSVEVRLKRSF